MTELATTGAGRAFWSLKTRVLDQVPILVLLVGCIVAAVLSDRFATPGNLANVLLQAAIFAVLAIGMTFVIITGGFDLSIGSTAAMASCVTAAVMLEFGIALGMVAGLGLGLLVGIVNGLVIAKLRVNPFIATLGTMVLVRGAALLMTDGAPVVGDTGLPRSFIDFGLARPLSVPSLVWGAIIFILVFGWVLHRTPFGVRVFAVGGNPQAAFLSGVRVDNVLIACYAISGALAGVAGVMLTARLHSGQPTAGEFYELTVIAAVVLGGASLQGGEGKLYNSIVGVLIMTVLANALNLINVDSYWQRVAIGVVIVTAAAFDQLRRR